MQEKIEGWYVDGNGKTIEVVALRTTNPRIVDLSEAYLGLAVVDQQFFEDEGDARDQAKANAEDTIAACEELLEDLNQPTKKHTTSTKSGGLFRRSKQTDPLGPPEYGVGKTLRNRKAGSTWKIIGFRDEDDEVLYILNAKSGSGSARLNREQLDRQYEVVA